MSRLSDALFSETRQNLLGLLYGRPEQSFYLKQILRLTGMGVATIKRDLDRMLDAGILTMIRIGNQHHYQANPECPIYGELLAIVNKTIGLAEVIRLALAPMADRINHAFLFGSLARGRESSGSDVDLLLVGDVKFSKVVKALYPAQETLGREVNPKLFTDKEWHDLRESGDAFVKEILAAPRLDVMGHMDESGQPVGYQP